MKRSRFSEERIIAILKDGNRFRQSAKPTAGAAYRQPGHLRCRLFCLPKSGRKREAKTTGTIEAKACCC